MAGTSAAVAARMRNSSIVISTGPPDEQAQRARDALVLKRIGDILSSVDTRHESPANGPSMAGATAVSRGPESRRPCGDPREGHGDEAESARIRGGRLVVPYDGRRRGGIRPKAGRHPETVFARQPGEHVNP